MTDHAAVHDLTDTAALYALGALSQTEAQSFESHLAEGCATCRAELKSFEFTVRALAYDTQSAEPPVKVRDELLLAVNKPASDRSTESERIGDLPPIMSILASDGKWHEVQEGVLVKNLNFDRSTGLATSLVRMLPGMALPPHQHIGVEQFYILEGDCYVAGQRLGAGDYHRAEKGSIHESTYTVDGTLFLLIAPERYEVLEAR